MPPCRKYSDGEVSSALSGYVLGHSQRVIARVLSIPRETIRAWIGGYCAGRIPIMVRSHAHHWIIERPTGAISSGVCKVCFSRRDFRNSLCDEGQGWLGSAGLAFEREVRWAGS